MKPRDNSYTATSLGTPSLIDQDLLVRAHGTSQTNHPQLLDALAHVKHSHTHTPPPHKRDRDAARGGGAIVPMYGLRRTEYGICTHQKV